MKHPDDSLRNRLLDQIVPEPGKLARYRKEVQAMLEREERMLRIEKWYSSMMWCMAVAMGVGFSLAAAYGRDQPTRVYFSIGVTLLVLFTTGSVELLKHFIDRARLQVVKDIKGLELRILELEGRLGDRSQ
jgi:hypothetical protein